MFFFLSLNPAASFENSSPASGCDCLPSFPCEEGYLSSDSNDVSLNLLFAREGEKNKHVCRYMHNVKVPILSLVHFIQLMAESAFDLWVHS